MKTKLTIILVLLFNTSIAQKPQIGDFQRFMFNSSKDYVQKNNRHEYLDQKMSYLMSFGEGWSALQYNTTLIGLRATVCYSFYKDNLTMIDFKPDCTPSSIEKGRSNECTTQTLQEFIKIRNCLNELLGEESRCVNCIECYTRVVEIPDEYNPVFETFLINLTRDYPKNYQICTKWTDYTNNSTIELLYTVISGWHIVISKNN